MMLWPIWRRSFDPCTRLSDPLTRSGIVQSPLVPASFHDVLLFQCVYRMRVLYVPGVRTVRAEPAWSSPVAAWFELSSAVARRSPLTPVAVNPMSSMVMLAVWSTFP